MERSRSYISHIFHQQGTYSKRIRINSYPKPNISGTWHFSIESDIEIESDIISQTNPCANIHKHGEHTNKNMGFYTNWPGLTYKWGFYKQTWDYDNTWVFTVTDVRFYAGAWGFCGKKLLNFFILQAAACYNTETGGIDRE